MEEEFQFYFKMRCGNPVIEEEFTGYSIDLLPYKGGYEECTYWNFDTDDHFCDEYGNELDDSELPPGFEEAFNKFMETDEDLNNFDTVYKQGLEDYKNEQIDRYIEEQMEASRYDN